MMQPMHMDAGLRWAPDRPLVRCDATNVELVRYLQKVSKKESPPVSPSRNKDDHRDRRELPVVMS